MERSSYSYSWSTNTSSSSFTNVEPGNFKTVTFERHFSSKPQRRIQYEEDELESKELVSTTSVVVDSVAVDTIEAATQAQTIDVEQEAPAPVEEKKPGTSDILNGHLLPMAVRSKVKSEWTGLPMKEISSKYANDDTFVVIGKGSRILYRFGDAACFNSSGGGWKNQAISILTHGVFNYILVLAVLINCIMYAAIPYEASGPQAAALRVRRSVAGSHTDYSMLAKIANFVFLILYVLEFALKAVARGLYSSRNPFSCLRISWSWLDLFVIIVGILNLASPTNRTIAALNAFRALKLIPLIPSWLSGYDRVIKKFWLPLLRLAIFGIIVHFLLSLVGQELYYSGLRNKCVLKGTRDVSDGPFLKHALGEFFICGNYSMSEQCPVDYVCVTAGKGPQNGYVGFDSYFSTKLTVLSLEVQDFAEYVYEKVWAAYGHHQITYAFLVFALGTYAIGALLYATLGYAFINGYAKLAMEWEQVHKKGTSSGDVDSDMKTTPSSLFEKARAKGKEIVTHENFDLVITIFILLDILLHALDHYDVTSKPVFTHFLEYAPKVIYAVYCLEFVLKIVFLGVKGYISQPWAKFDLAIVVLIVLHSIFANELFMYLMPLTVLKIVPRWPALNFLFNIMHKSVWESVRWGFALYGIILFVFAYLGYVGFGHFYTANILKFPNSELPRWNLVDFWHSIRLMFRAFCGEYIETLWDLVMVAPPAPSFYLIIGAGLIGNLVTKILGVGIMLTTAHTLEQAAIEKNPKMTSLERMFFPIRWCISKVTSLLEEKKKKKEESDDPASKPLDPTIENGDAEKEEGDQIIEEEQVAKENGVADDVETATAKSVEKNGDAPSGNILDRILNHVAFNVFSSTVVLILSICTIPWPFISEIVFVAYFGLELIVRGIGCGVSRKFKISLTFAFDVLMVINSIVALCTEWSQGLWYVGSFRVLMIVGRINGLKIVRGQLWKEIKSLSTYFGATFFIWTLFAFLGVGAFMGSLNKCEENEKYVGHRVVHNRSECEKRGFVWRNSDVNFDNFGNGLWSLVYVAARNGWLLLIAGTEDSVKDLNQPFDDANPTAILFFVAFLLFGVLFPFYTIMGALLHQIHRKSWVVLFENFQKCCSSPKDKEAKDEKEEEAKEEPETRLVRCIKNPYFELWVCFTILVDATALAFQLNTDADDPKAYDDSDVFRLCILILFIVELCLRLFVERKGFFRSWLNILLVATIIFSLVELVLTQVEIYGYSFMIIRTFRLLHLISLDSIGKWKLPEWKAFRLGLCKTFIPIAFLIGFYFLIYFSYALFGYYAFRGHKDFESWNAMTAFFKVVTISGLDGIYGRLSKEGIAPCPSEGQCEAGEHPTLGAFYIVTALASTILVFVNVYFALVLAIIGQLREQENPAPKAAVETDTLEKLEEEAEQLVEALDIAED